MTAPPSAPRHLLAACLLVLGGCKAEPPAFVPTEVAPTIRRLTAAQYNNVVHDLLAPANISYVHFPPELPVDGFLNNVAVNTATRSLVEAWSVGARQVAREVLDQLPKASGCPGEESACLRTWLRDLASRAWRRPLTGGEEASLMADFDAWSGGLGSRRAVELTLEYVLQSADFLYFPEPGAGPVTSEGWVPLSSWEIATRLSMFLWNSIPDATLIAQARADALRSPEAIMTEARRMLADRRAESGVLSFYSQLLQLDRVGSKGLDFGLFSNTVSATEGDFRERLHGPLQAAMQVEALLFIRSELFEGPGTLASLLTSRRTWVNDDLARVYGLKDPPPSPSVEWTGNLALGFERPFSGSFRSVELPAHERAGFLTLPGTLHARSSPAWPSPTYRGIFIQERLIACQPPPPAIGDVISGLCPFTPGLFDCMDPNQKYQSNRDRYSEHVSNSECIGCHLATDYVGFAFENYDSLGRYRTSESGHPIDASGELLGTDVDRPVANAIELIEAMATSRVVHDCHVTQWFRYAFGRTLGASDQVELESAARRFWDDGGNVTNLIVNITGSHLFRHRRVTL